MPIILWPFCELKLVQSEKISQIKLTLCPTHEGMVEIASVFDFKKKHNTTSTVDPECKKSGNFTTNGPPFRNRFCPFDSATKQKKIILAQACRTFFWCEKSCFRRMRPSQFVHFWSVCRGGPPLLLPESRVRLYHWLEVLVEFVKPCEKMRKFFWLFWEN